MVRLSISLVIALVLFTSCSKNKEHTPVVSNLVQEKVSLPKNLSALALERNPVAISTKITMNKSAILGRTFLYGSSLQFSSMNDGDMDTALMAIAIGEQPAIFQIVDEKLRLVTDSRLNFESDVNHPERMIIEFPILSQDENTITVKADKASPVLASVLVDSADAPRNSWVRSLEYSQKDELLLMESSIEMADGSLAEFMETLMPREKVVPAKFNPYYVDEDLNEASLDYRFITGDEVYINNPSNPRERIKTHIAQRFLLKDGEVIHWWVTPNIQDEYLPYIKYAIEGWNRYSQSMWKKDIVRFEGKLPEGVKIGDPRYNVVVWDTVQDSGAAYASQGADPLTGIQTHALIYLPYAWINIGKEFWDSAKYSEEDKTSRQKNLQSFLKSRKIFGRKLPVNCFESSVHQLNIASKLKPEEFARSLLKGSLFHEVGHTLGFAHNFKGSLSYDPNDPDSIFSYSIMDYNVYNEESSAFTSLESSDGPLLEYDRQLLSVLYNEGKDVSDNDELIPACDDDEADSEHGGIDALCNRYDMGHDPTETALEAVLLLTDPNAKSGKMDSLPKALMATINDLPAAEQIKTLDQAKLALKKLLLGINGVSRIYISSSANSLAYKGSQAARSLFVTAEDSLPEGYSEIGMRVRAYHLLQNISELNEFPAATKNSLDQIKTETQNWLKLTPFFTNANQKDRQKMMDLLMLYMNKTIATTEATVFSKMHKTLAAELTYKPSAPLSFVDAGTISPNIIDLEKEVIKFLEVLSSPNIGAQKRLMAERTVATLALATYSKTENGASTISRLKNSLAEEIRATQDAEVREELRKLLKSLT